MKSDIDRLIIELIERAEYSKIMARGEDSDYWEGSAEGLEEAVKLIKDRLEWEIEESK
jgi:hypothetical protein